MCGVEAPPFPCPDVNARLKHYSVAPGYRIRPNDTGLGPMLLLVLWTTLERVLVVAAQRTQPLSKAELHTLRTLVKRLMFETDRGKIRSLLEELTRIVEDDPQERRPN
jgi:hypothetical protein